MNTFLIRYYKDGSIELPDGRVIREKDMMERAADHSDTVPIETFKEVYDLVKAICLEEHKKLKLEVNGGQTILYFEFVDQNLDDSRSPVLNN
jgi:hypothetical protein